jgi:uncharacterized protein
MRHGPWDGDGEGADVQDVFHEGELEVQRRAGVADRAARLTGMIQPTLDAGFAAFLATQPMVVLGSATADGRVWSSTLIGPPGFVRAAAPDRLVVGALPDPTHPLAGLGGDPTPVGLLALDVGTRDRIRVNGVARRTSEGIEIRVREAFGNCPKYIQVRRPVRVEHERRPRAVRVGEDLDDDARALIAAADTFFVASRHAERGVDVSHRGGRPGFVATSPGGRTLTFPDYQGNNMFQTLGNVTVDPAVGLLFVDWESGRALHVSGTATIVWDGPRLAGLPGVQRLVDVQVDRVVDRADASPIVWELVEAHRLNPELASTGGARE